VPNYIELLQGDPAVVALALNVAELEGEERTHAWETEDGFEVDAGVVVGESGGPLAWFPVRHETPDAFMEPEGIVHPNGALAMMAIHAVAEGNHGRSPRRWRPRGQPRSRRSSKAA